MENIKIHLSIDCGNKKRVIYCHDNNPENGIRIGCTTYTLEGAIEAINKNYDGEEAEAYIKKVHECFDGMMDIDSDLMSFKWKVRDLFARYGTNDHRTSLLNDPDSDVRCVVAKYGTDEHRKFLLDDPDWSVRESVAIYGTNEHRDILVNDPDLDVRCAVAEYGTNKHCDVLVNDPYWVVRMTVAQYGTNEHRTALINDPDWDVRRAAERHMITNQT
jgi:uncharacterized protein YuzB (UPF0349 family)